MFSSFRKSKSCKYDSNNNNIQRQKIQIIIIYKGKNKKIFRIIMKNLLIIKKYIDVLIALQFQNY